MRKASKTAGWLLATVAVSGAVQAQGPVMLHNRPTASRQAAPETVRPAVSPERSLEIQVQLAWLADPMTFPYFLDAKVQGRTLELSGTVPTKAVRDHAVKLARLQAPNLTLRDAVSEHPGVAARLETRGTNIEGAAKTALRQVFPDQERNFSVKATSDGRLQVSGRAQNLEDKLAVSQALRRLHGCSGIVNQVVVPEQPAYNSAAPAGASSGKMALSQPGHSPTTGPDLGAPPKLSQMPVSTSTTVTNPGLHGKPAMTGTDGPALIPAATPSLPRGPGLASNGNVSGPAMVQQVQSVVPAVQPTKVLPTSLGQVAGKPDAPVMMVEQAPPGSGKGPARPSLFTKLFGPKYPPATPVPSPMPMPMKMQTVSAPAAAKTPAPEPVVSQGVVLVQSDSKGPTYPMVSPPATPAKAMSVSPEAQGPQAARLKRVVEQTGGAAVRNVQVGFRSPTEVSLQFTARSEAEANRLAQHLLVMPEFRDYQVQLNIQIGDAPR